METHQEENGAASTRGQISRPSCHHVSLLVAYRRGQERVPRVFRRSLLVLSCYWNKSNPAQQSSISPRDVSSPSMPRARRPATFGRKTAARRVCHVRYYRMNGDALVTSMRRMFEPTQLGDTWGRGLSDWPVEREPRPQTGGCKNWS